MRRTLLIYTSLRFVPLSVAWAFDESDLKKLQTLNESNKCDLSKADHLVDNEKRIVPPYCISHHASYSSGWVRISSCRGV